MGKRNQQHRGVTVGQLASSKGPQCSEMNARVQGCVKSIEEQHRKQVELMFRDRNLVLSRVNKSQSLVYRTMLRVHKEKKIRERELYRRHVEASKSEDHSQDKDSTGIMDRTSATHHAVVQIQSTPRAASPEPHNTDTLPDCCLREYFNHLVSLDRERSQADPPSMSKVRSLTLPHLGETNGFVRKQLREKTRETDTNVDGMTEREHSVHNGDASSTWPGPWPNDRPASALHTNMDPSWDTTQPAAHQSDQSTGNRPNHSSTCSVQQAHPRKQSTHSQPSPDTGRESHPRVEDKKHRPVAKKSLDQEPVVVYLMNDDGNIVPADNNKQYQRQEFPMPSLRQQHQQQKLLQSELSAAAQHKEKADKFFERLEIENENAANRRRHLAKMAASKTARSSARIERSGGVTLSELAAVFQHPEQIAEGVDPNSIEAVKICKYVRKCQPLLMSQKERRDAVNNRRSSWNHAR